LLLRDILTARMAGRTVGMKDFGTSTSHIVCSVC
jgi:hypothetical protein